jgi:hypothetical protein
LRLFRLCLRKRKTASMIARKLPTPTPTPTPIATAFESSPPSSGELGVGVAVEDPIG